MSAYHTLETNPLTIIDHPDLHQPFIVTNVVLGIRRGIEFHAGSSAISDPAADCWFAITLEWPGSHHRPDGSKEFDIIVTNGDKFHRCRRSLGKSPLVFTEQCKEVLQQAITTFVNKL